MIVVAILAILAAIAIPNLLEAQIRAKVSRAKSDFRAVAIALDSCAVDWSAYPPLRHWAYTFETLETSGSSVTTPVANLTAVPARDPFHPDHWANTRGLYQYFYYAPSPSNWIGQTGYPPRRAWSLICWGRRSARPPRPSISNIRRPEILAAACPLFSTTRPGVPQAAAASSVSAAPPKAPSPPNRADACATWFPSALPLPPRYCACGGREDSIKR